MAEKKKKKLNKSQRKYLISIIVLVAVIIFTAYTLLSQGDVNEIITILSDAKAIYVLLLVALELVCLGLEGLAIMIFTRLYRRKYRWYQGTLNGGIGSFFSGITPFSSGGQFAQIFTFTQQGVRPADAASILVMLFIVTQSNIILYGLLGMIFGYKTTVALMENIKIFSWEFSPISISIIGFALNVWTLLFLVFMAYSRHFHHFVLNVIVGIGAKLHLIKDPNKKRMSLIASTTTFRFEMHRLLQNCPVLLSTFLIEFVKFGLIHLIPYFSGLALIKEPAAIDAIRPQWLNCLWADSYVNMLTAVVPIPGGSGGAELAFSLLYTNIFNNPSITTAANILSRIISFYFPLLFGLLVFIFYRSSPKKDAFKYDGTKTFVDLQIVKASEDLKDEIARTKDKVDLPKLRHVHIVGPEDEVHSDKTIQIKMVNKVKKHRKGRGRNFIRDRINMITEDDNAVLTNEEVEESFKELSKSMLYKNTNEVKEEKSSYYDESKDVLKETFADIEQKDKELEEDKRSNAEIEEAIQLDIAKLRAEQERREERRKEKEKQKKEADDADNNSEGKI